jgi:nitrogenase molybdenum-iron protein NifN
VAGKRACVYGEEDLVAAVAGFLAEIGVEPALCLSGGAAGGLAQAVERAVAEAGPAGAGAETPGASWSPRVADDSDFGRMEELIREDPPDILIGHSKGYRFARAAGLPLLRLGFPIHDRIGAQRLMHLGYRGTQELFDRLVNTLLETKQETSPVGYFYL